MQVIVVSPPDFGSLSRAIGDGRELCGSARGQRRLEGLNRMLHNLATKVASMGLLQVPHPARLLALPVVLFHRKSSGGGRGRSLRGAAFDDLNLCGETDGRALCPLL